MRCKTCLKQQPSLKHCSGCKSVLYCSSNCQRVDWKDGGHKTDCGRLKAERSKLSTAFGRVDSAEVALRILRAEEGGGGLISKVLLPSADVAERLIDGERFASKKGKLAIEEKDGNWFVDVLGFYLVVDPGEGVVDRRKNLNLNDADAFFLAVVGECHARRMSLAVDRSAADYLTVVRANLAAIREVMRDAGERTMDRFEFLFFALHWMEVQALIVAGRAKLVIEDYSAAEAHLDDAGTVLDLMSSASFDAPADRKQVDAVKDQIVALRVQLPTHRLRSLNLQWEELKAKEETALESMMVLRKLGSLKMRSGDVEGGRKNLIKSLNQMVKYDNSVKDLLSPGEDRSGFLACLGEAYEVCALEAMAGEDGKGASEVVKMQRKAMELYRQADVPRKTLEANIRLWNWHRNGRVYLRRSDWMRAKKHPQFSTRLPESSDQTLDQILEELRSQLEFGLDEKCQLCERALSWNDVEDDPLEVLVGCGHSFHTMCLDLYAEEHDKECPTCHVMFID